MSDSQDHIGTFFKVYGTQNNSNKIKTEMLFAHFQYVRLSLASYIKSLLPSLSQHISDAIYVI